MIRDTMFTLIVPVLWGVLPGRPNALAKPPGTLPSEPDWPVYLVPLPNGTTVELLGVSNEPGNSQAWWNADGSALDGAPYRPVVASQAPLPSQHVFQFVVRTINKGFPKKVVYETPRVRIAGADSNVRIPSNRQEPPVYIIEAYLPRDHGDGVDLRVGLSTAWEPEVVAVHRGASMMWDIAPPYRYDGGGIIFHKLREDGHNLLITASYTDHEPYGRSSLVVVDRGGEEHNAAGNSYAQTNGFTSGIWRFSDVGLEEVRRVELRIQTYAYAVFKGVSLKRGKRTQLRLGMEDQAPVNVAPDPSLAKGDSEGSSESSPATAGQPAEAKPKRAPIYDETADPQNDIANALTRARKVDKRVLIIYGGNWCSWCYTFEELLSKDPEIIRVIGKCYEMVHVEAVKHPGIGKKYGTDTQKGYPYLTVLDANGKVVANQETGVFEEGKGYKPAVVLEFFLKHRPKTASGPAESTSKAAS